MTSGDSAAKKTLSRGNLHHSPGVDTRFPTSQWMMGHVFQIPIVFRKFEGYPQFQRITTNGLNWVACPNFRHTQCPNINLWNVVGLYPLRDIVNTKKILML